MILSSIKIEDVVWLEQYFTKRISDGDGDDAWETPAYITELRNHIVDRDAGAVTFGNDCWKAVVANKLQRPDFNCKGAALAFSRAVAGAKRKAEPVEN